MSERIAKPKGYKNHFVVYDPHPILIISLDYTSFQASRKLSDDEGDEFEVEEDGDYLVITNKSDE